MFLEAEIGIVRVGQRYLQEEGTRVAAPRNVINFLNRSVDDVFVIVDLYAARANAGLGQHADVRCAVETLGAPVGGPFKVARIDVAGQALFKPVQLVRSDEMHFSREAGPIAKRTQVVRVGRHRGGKLGGIVKGADL